MPKTTTILMACTLGLLVVLTPRYILPVCEFKGFARMYCSDAAHWEAWIGGAVVMMAIGLSFSGKKILRVMFSLLIAGAGVLVVAVPQVTKFCKSPTMPCNYGSIPALRLLGIGIVVLGLIAARVLSKESDPGA